MATEAFVNALQENNNILKYEKIITIEGNWIAWWCGWEIVWIAVQITIVLAELERWWLSGLTCVLEHKESAIGTLLCNAELVT